MTVINHRLRRYESERGKLIWTVVLHNDHEFTVEADELCWGYNGHVNDDGSWRSGTLLAFNDDDPYAAWDSAAAWVPCRPHAAYLFTSTRKVTMADAWKPRDDRAEIWTNDLDRATAEAWNALEAANDAEDSAEFVFRHGDVPSRLEHNDEGRLIPRVLIPTRMRYRLNQVAVWIRQNKEEERQLPGAPMEIVNNVLATPDPRLPVLDQIIDVPTLGRNGKVHDAPGYSAGSRTFYEPAKGLTVPKVAARPTKQERTRARRLITDELLGDFPFVAESERAHAVAMLLQPFVRARFSSVAVVSGRGTYARHRQELVGEGGLLGGGWHAAAAHHRGQGRGRVA